MACVDVRIGGSFGVVYKAIERATGELVAIKHVRPIYLPLCSLIQNMADGRED